ncbi:helix-turn-helix domain-containing protein [Streptomyces sp. H27-D2]|uniref:helix-turn-helix domain-containing protein n=1 Tax=Streptomyces sp. H27-D2 TaxID=3046304 RepID=UPI002DBF359D|nr:helix-turn-helix transcriptional regulator [Streptomyces sp. H27-D2]MEC4020536.1 helix-turn-helix transcriptional regulator [Streptomyces sp. H27-D2]
MPPRTTATARQQRLGAELRRLRERAGLSTREAGQKLGVDPARISNIESGRFGVSADRVRTFALGYDCSDTGLIEALREMTAGRSRNWWDDYRETLPSVLLDLAELEHRATEIRTAQFTHLPGLLQTTDYARLVFRQNVPVLPPPEIEYRLSHRIKRQGILYRDDPTPYTAIIHEAALRMQFGGADLMREQLVHIAEMSERDGVDVLVLPFSAGIFPGAGQTVVYAEGPVPQLDTVQLDTEHGSEFLHAEAQLVKYRTIMERFENASLDAASSRAFILGTIANS